MVGAELAVPGREFSAQARDHRGAAIQLDAVPLTVIEANRLDGGEVRQCPSEASGRILPAGEQDQRLFRAWFDRLVHVLAHMHEIACRRVRINEPSAASGTIEDRAPAASAVIVAAFVALEVP